MKQNASKIRTLARSVVSQRFVGEPVQFSEPSVFRDLAIPRCRVEFGEPSPESGEFLSGERRDFFLDGLDTIHGAKVAPLRFLANSMKKGRLTEG
ncbi:MAG: hypothetical protein HY899_17610 [Deltaproteobacteria bacterium]|nr:hypothetical protein [Deltaproteobacteria bacterium]